MPIIWRFRDGKPGHERQTAGFVQALNAETTCEVIDIPVAHRASHWRSAWQVLTRTFPAFQSPPHFLIGAGNRCQLPMLAAQRTWGGRCVYFMRPSLPSAWFDLCVIPKHDQVRRRPNLIETEGVINDLGNSKAGARNTSLILIGGPSDHYGWDSDNILTQLQALIAALPQTRFTLSGSRRTPPDTLARLKLLDGVDFQNHEETDASWLPQQFAAAKVVWVTIDSVSMMYEALSCGANLGLLDVPARRDSRITRIANDLVKRKFATRFYDWQTDHKMASSPHLNEASRVAAIVMQRYPESFRAD